MYDKNRQLVIVLAIFALEAIFFSAGNFKLNERDRLEEERIEKIQVSLNDIPILAKAVSIYNISQNKKIYGKNDDIVLPIASLAKIMTVVIALNSYEPDDVISISQDAVNQAGDYGIFVNEKWKVSDIAKFTLISSANDGAYALSENNPDDFLEKINSKAKRIGMEHSYFLNFTGLDIVDKAGLPAQAGAFASATDVNTMAMFGLLSYPEIFSVTTLPEINLKSESGFVHNFKSTNIIVDRIPNLLFSKTGYTEVAGGNLVIIFKDKRREEIAVTILDSTFDGRFSDMEKIMEILYNS